MTKKLDKSLILETLALSGILAALELFLFPGILVRWNPSPLWLMVLLICMRYGSPAGLFGASAAVALHLWGEARAGHSLQESLHMNPAMLVVPVLYLGVGLFLGEARERLERRGAYFKDMASDLSRRLDANEVKRLNLERGRLEMEKRIAAQTDTLRNVYTSLNRLASARSEAELWEILAEVAHRELRAEVCGVWRVFPEKLLAVTGAWVGYMPPLAAMASKKRAAVTAADWTAAEGNVNPGAELAGAVATGEPSNRIVVAVAGMNFGSLNRSSAILFSLIVERAGAVFQEIRRIEALKRVSISDPELGLSSENYLRNRVREQTLLARRYKTDLTLLACAPLRQYSRAAAERLDVVLACAIRAITRGSDGVAYFPEGQSFVAMLPGTDAAGAAIVSDKIAAAIESLDLRDGDGRLALELKWNILSVAGGDDEAEVYRRLFAGMAARKREAAG